MSGICRILGKITLVLGLIGAFAVAMIYGETYQDEIIYKTVKTVTQRNWGLTIGLFVGIAFSAVILAVILMALGDILETLEHHDIIIKDSEQGLKLLTKQAKDQETLAGGGWQCPKCNAVNYFHTKTCKCGYDRPE